MTWQIVRADARALPLDDETVDLIVTSPPYWGLRSYRDGGEHYDGQIGSETTPQQFVDELVGMIDGEWRRVLKPSGSMFLNLGDKYAGAGGGNDNTGLGNARGEQGEATDSRGNPRRYRGGLEQARPKSLLGLPWRIALALIDRGWILRAEIVWSKPNGLPESVTDRVRRSHEQIFHFTVNPRYYAAVDRIREEHRPVSLARAMPHRANVLAHEDQHEVDMTQACHPLGRLPGSVWTIPTQPLIVPDAHRKHWNLPDHFAAYPPELVRRIVLGWSPERVCVKCGEGRRPVVDKSAEGRARDDHGMGARHRGNADEMDGDNRTACNRSEWAEGVLRSIVGECCACPDTTADTRPGVVLDPMCGTGTTVGVAHKLGRHAIGTDLSEDYCRLARWRVEHSGHFDQIDQRTAAEQQGALL